MRTAWVKRMLSRAIAGLRELRRHAVLQARARRRVIIAADPRPFGLAERRQQRQVDGLVVAVVEVGARAAERREAGGPGGHQHLAVA